MATYSYDDYLKRLQESGQTMSDADSRIAQSNPDAGVSLLTYKTDFANATTDSARALAHANAEEIRRRYGNYSGGADGSGFALVTDNPSYTPNWDKRIAGEYDNMQKNFSWSPDSDPLTKYYTKAYEREGQRAYDNAIGSLASRTGGQASSYAASAAAQAQNNYMQQLTDKYPELYQQAYNNFLSEYQRHAQNAQAFQSQDSIEYTRYLNDLENARQRKLDQAAADQQAWENTFKEDQFNADNDYRNATLAEEIREFDINDEFRKAGLEEEKRQFDENMTLALKQFEEGQQQFLKTLIYQYAALKQSGDLAKLENDYKYAALDQNQKQFVEEFGLKLASMGVQLGDYSKMGELGINVDPNVANGLDPITLAKLGAEVGDYSGYEALGITPNTDYTNGLNPLNKALLQAQYGDYSGLQALGINLKDDYDPKTVSEQLAIAQAAGNLGDFSFYQKYFDIDPSLYQNYVLGQMGIEPKDTTIRAGMTPDEYLEYLNTFPIAKK